MSSFFQQPELVFLVGLASLIPVVKGFINPAIVSLLKNFRFRADTAYQLSLRLVETALAILLVWLTHSVVGWVAALILTGVFEVAISFLFFRTRPTFRYSSSRGSVILGNAKGLALSSVLGYLNENMDNLLVGKLAGTYALGLYQPTYSMTHQATYEVAKSLYYGSFPALTRIASDKPRLKRAFIRILTLGLVIAAAISTPLLLAPTQLMTLAFGPEWQAAGSLVSWLVVAGIAQAAFMLCYSVFLTRNALKSLNFHQAVTFVTMISAMWFLARSSGVYGAVVGLALSRVVTLPLLGWLVWRELKCWRD